MQVRSPSSLRDTRVSLSYSPISKYNPKIYNFAFIQRAISIRISTVNIAIPKPSLNVRKPFLFSPPPTLDPDSRNVVLRNRLSVITVPGDQGDGGVKDTASVRKWRLSDLVWMVRNHPFLCAFILSLFFFMRVEYTLHMVPPTSPPYDLGFVATRSLHRILSSRPLLNTALAGLNTVFVGMQICYILWALIIEGRARPGIAALFTFSCRGILGYSTQLPLPKDYLGSGVDFPVGNVSFFLFYSGHVASAVIGSLDMSRMQRKKLAILFDFLNVMQIVRLLATRGHYTIDLAVGVGAGILFDFLAGKYEGRKVIALGGYVPLEDRNERVG